MARYFFNLSCNDKEIRDEEGVELPNIQEALPWIADAIEEFGLGDPLSQTEWQGWTLEIRDWEGRIARRFNLTSANAALGTMH
jgi:hypothetical protein